MRLRVNYGGNNMKKLTKYNILIISMEVFIIVGAICNIISKRENEVLNVIHFICVVIATILCTILLINLRGFKKAIKEAKEEKENNK